MKIIGIERVDFIDNDELLYIKFRMKILNGGNMEEYYYERQLNKINDNVDIGLSDDKGNEIINEEVLFWITDFFERITDFKVNDLSVMDFFV